MSKLLLFERNAWVLFFERTKVDAGTFTQWSIERFQPCNAVHPCAHVFLGCKEAPTPQLRPQNM